MSTAIAPRHLCVEIGGLEARTTYVARVWAANEAGGGNSTSSLPIQTLPASLPLSIRDIRVTSVTGSVVSATWLVPFDTGGLVVSR